jgi:hypothetical protein
MKINYQFGIIFTGFLLTILVAQEPASAIPYHWIREGGEGLWDTGRKTVDDWFGNSPQNRNRLEQAGEWYFQDEDAHIKACGRGVKAGLEERGDRQNDMNWGTYSRSTRVTKYGCRDVTDRLY